MVIQWLRIKLWHTLDRRVGAPEMHRGSSAEAPLASPLSPRVMALLHRPAAPLLTTSR
jgi:hypothetical protein